MLDSSPSSGLLSAKMRRAVFLLPSAAAAFLIARLGWAQVEGSPPGALARFEPTPAGDAFFGVPSPAVAGNFVPRFAAVFNYAHRPLSIDDGATRHVIIGIKPFCTRTHRSRFSIRYSSPSIFPLPWHKAGIAPRLPAPASPLPPRPRLPIHASAPAFSFMVATGIPCRSAWAAISMCP